MAHGWIMALHDFFMKFNLATGGQNPNDALNRALAGVGLQPRSQSGAQAEYGGQFEGRPAMLRVDGSAVTAAGNAAYARAMGTHVAEGLGLISAGFADWRTQMNELHARRGMREARMSFHFGLDGGRPPLAQVLVSREASLGHPVAPDLFMQTSAEAWPHLTQPFVVTRLQQGAFDQIRAQPGSTWIEALAMPRMADYQRVAADPAAFGRMVGSTLSALSGVAQILCPR